MLKNLDYKMKYLKYFEKIDSDKEIYLLCVNEIDFNSYYKFTKGKKYKLYSSPKNGKRLIDNNNHFASIWIKNEENNILIFENPVGHIFTTENSLEDYERRLDAKKFGL